MENNHFGFDLRSHVSKIKRNKTPRKKKIHTGIHAGTYIYSLILIVCIGGLAYLHLFLIWQGARLRLWNELIKDIGGGGGGQSKGTLTILRPFLLLPFCFPDIVHGGSSHLYIHRVFWHSRVAIVCGNNKNGKRKRCETPCHGRPTSHTKRIIWRRHSIFRFHF